MRNVDMRGYAKSAGVTDPGNCLYIVQSGELEMMIGGKTVELCGPNEVIGFMSMIDRALRASTARVKSDAELSMLDQRKFRFMVDEVPFLPSRL